MKAMSESPWNKTIITFFCLTLCFSSIAQDTKNNSPSTNSTLNNNLIPSDEDSADAEPIFEPTEIPDEVDTEGVSLLYEDQFDEQKNQGLVSEDDFQDDNPSSLSNLRPERLATNRIINNIIIAGNNLVSKEAILNYVPYKIGEPFDLNNTGKLIRNLFNNLKRFRNIQVKGQLLDNGLLDLYIIVEEKPALKEIIFRGNNQISEKDIKKKIDFDIPAIDEAELNKYAKKIKRLYRDKSFHNAVVESELEIDNDNKARAIFTITEGEKTLVSRIKFKGNKHVSDKELRSVMYTREDWLLGFLDNSGNFQPERLEGDKHVIEQYYQNKGFLTAKVTDIDVVMDKEKNTFILTFEIQEGDCYTIGNVSAEGNDIVKEDYLLSILPVKSGDTYSREQIAESIKILEMIWGELGYIYAHIDPSMLPNEETKTVDIAFHSELGSKVFLNKINIVGNSKTRDKVIRRRLALEDGSLLTHRRMEDSKNRVEGLGYFDKRDGVNWKTRRVDAEKADLDLMLKEVKTGRANIKLGFGGAGSMQTPGSKFSLGVEVADTNIMGSGISASLEANLSKDEQNIYFNLTDPWLFDKPITGAFDFYHKRPSYDELKNTKPVNEKLTGGSLTAGFVSPRLLETQVLFRGGLDSLSYENKPVARQQDPIAKAEYQYILDQEFKRVDFFWFSSHFAQDTRNNPMHPTRGTRWTLVGRFGLPTWGSDVKFAKVDFDYHWFTPLIGEFDLILHFHTYLGVISRINKGIVPFRELFHIGGPSTVRGFEFGQLSPRYQGDYIGGTKALYVNTELIFPISPDFSMKGLVFYDGGTGWSNPYVDNISKRFVTNNSFDYRHAVGVGIRLLNPAPIRIDWGFKLDRRKNEPANEVHFGMSYDW